MTLKQNHPFKALKINSADNVATALTDIPEGEEASVLSDDGSLLRIEAIDHIPLAHKIALVKIATGGKIVKYGESIGAATREIRPGEHVHIANVRSLRGC